jgi:hypothetical protein
MKTLKFLLLSIIIALSISCSKDEPTKPTIYGKWEYYETDDHSTVKIINMSNRDYPGNVPGCKKDYLNFEHGKTVFRGDFHDDCELTIYSGTWEERAGILSLNSIDDVGDFKMEFLDNNTLKLTWVSSYPHPDKAANDYYILKRAEIEL